MNPYKQYKPSGVEWLGKVPEHWEVKRLKFAVENISEKINAQESELRYFGLENIESFTAKLLEEIELESEGVAHLFQENDVLFGKLRPYLAKVYLAEMQGLVSTEALVLRTNGEILPNYLKYFVLSNEFIKMVNGTTFGSKMPRASWDNIGNFPICMPSETEQTAIAAYLDERTAYLDRLIAKQQALSEKLSEKRTALITEEVCGRLHINMRDDHRNNPNGCRDTELTPALRDSGIQWLGEIPEHWEVWKITHLVEFIGSGTTPKSDNPAYYDGETLWVTTSELRENYISDTKQKVSQEAIKDFSTLKIYPKNSVAIAMYGATIGRLGILEKEATFNQACCVFVPSEKLHYKFLFYWLWHRRPILISLSNGGGQPNLSQDDLKKIKIAIPSYKEQTAIATYLDKETAKIDRLQAKIAESVARLQEYRAALITQVVTGKVQVAAPAV